jgi:hypothetical protein
MIRARIPAARILAQIKRIQKSPPKGGLSNDLCVIS